MNKYILMVFLFLTILGCTNSDSKNELSEKFLGQCSEIKDIEEKNICFFMSSIASKDISLCENIQSNSSNIFMLPSSGGIEGCKTHIYIVEQNEDNCENLPEDNRNYCIFKIATNTKNYDLCNNLPAFTGLANKYNCIMFISLEEKNILQYENSVDMSLDNPDLEYSEEIKDKIKKDSMDAYPVLTENIYPSYESDYEDKYGICQYIVDKSINYYCKTNFLTIENKQQYS